MNSDITLRFNGKEHPYDFFRDPDTGRKMWSIQDAAILPPMFTTDRPLFAHVPPEVEELIDQDYFYAGLGQENFEHLKRYYNAPGADARRKGTVLNGPRAIKSTITIGATLSMHAIRNAGFELNATTHWTNLSAVGSTDAHSGTYSAEQAVTSPKEFYQDLDGYGAFQGKTITVKCWVKNSGGAPFNTLKVGVDDGVAAASYSTGTASATWTQESVSISVNAAATQLRIIGYDSGAQTQTDYFDDFTIEVTGSNFANVPVTDFIDYDGNTYAAAGYHLLLWDDTDWDSIAVFSAPITSLAQWGAYLIIGLGIVVPYVYYDGTTFLVNTISDGKMEYLGNVAGTLWGNDSVYQCKSSTNPLNGGAWSAATDVQDSTKTITGILDHPDRVIVAQKDGVYEIESGGDVPSLIGELHQENHAYTGKNLIEWHGDIFVPSGHNPLYEYDFTDAVTSIITPSDSIYGQSDFVGKVLAMDGDSKYLYAILENATKVEVMCGRWEIIDGETDFWWHQVQELTLTATANNVRSCLIASEPNGIRRLWLGCAHATDGIYYLHHPANYGDVTADANYQMTKTSSLVSSWYEGEHKHIIKTFYSLTVRTYNCDANKYITVSYKKEGDTSFTTLAAVDDSPSETHYFPAGVTTKKLQLKFAFTSNSFTSSPQLLGLTLRCVARPFENDTDRLTINENGDFRTFGGFETSWKHAEYRDSPKNWYSITVISEGLTTAKYITFQYKVDDEASYTTHEEVFDTSPTQTIYFPDNTVSKIMYVKFTMASPDDTTLVSYILEGSIRPWRRKEMEFALLLAEKHSTLSGGKRLENVNTAANILRDIDDKEWPVTLTTWDGQQYDIIFKNLKERIHKEIPVGRDTVRKEYVFEVSALEAKLREE